MAGIIRVVLTIVVLIVAVGLYFAGILVTTPEAVITWTTETETNTAGFHVYRDESEDGAFDQRMTTELIRSKSPDGFTGADYEFRDPSVEQGKTYFYQLEELETSGNFNRLPDIVRYDANPIPDGGVALALFAVVLLIWLIPTPKRTETVMTETVA